MARTKKSKVDAVAEEIAGLSPDELLELRRRLSQAGSAGRRSVLEELLRTPEGPREHKHSIMELEGLGADFWRSIDVDEYLKRERGSWAS